MKRNRFKPLPKPKEPKKASSRRKRPAKPARSRTRPGLSLPRPSRQDLIHLALLLVLCAVFFYSFLGYRGLYETDEARYAEIAREMLVSGDFITPHLNYVKYFEKPPLTYWLVALSFKLFGLSEASARLVPAVFGTLTVLLTFLLGRSLWGSRQGFFAASTLATSAMFFGLSRILIVDMVLCFGVTLALYGAWQTLRQKAAGPYFFWIGCAVGFLSKALLGPGLPIMAVVLFGLLSGRHDLWRRLLYWPALVVFVLLSAPWVIWVSIKNPEFFNFFFIDENLGRLLTKRHHRYEPFYYYLQVLPGAIFPWVALLPWSLGESWPGRAWRREENQPWLFVMVWLVSFFLFFSASSSKMMHYILPLLPAACLILGNSLARLGQGGWRSPSPAGVRASLTGLALLSLAAGVAVLVVPALNPDIGFDRLGLALLLIPLATAGLGLLFFYLRGRTWAALAAPATAFLVMVLGAGVVAPHLEAYRSLKGLVEAARAEMTPRDLLVSYGDYYQGIPFYSRRRVAVVRNWGELDFGRRQAGPRARSWFIPDDDAFLQLLLSPRHRVLAFAKTRHFHEFQKWARGTPGLLLFEWARLGDKSLFSNRPRR